MAAEVLRRGMERVVEAVLHRVAERGRGERVVHGRGHTRRRAEGAERLEVGDAHGGVRDRLGVEERGARQRGGELGLVAWNRSGRRSRRSGASPSWPGRTPRRRAPASPRSGRRSTRRSSTGCGWPPSRRRTTWLPRSAPGSPPAPRTHPTSGSRSRACTCSRAAGTRSCRRTCRRRGSGTSTSGTGVCSGSPGRTGGRGRWVHRPRLEPPLPSVLPIGHGISLLLVHPTSWVAVAEVDDE